jgi:hypothetical protein
MWDRKMEEALPILIFLSHIFLSDDSWLEERTRPRQRYFSSDPEPRKFYLPCLQQKEFFTVVGS